MTARGPASARFFRGDRPVAAPDGGHRGIAYGDGLFETMRGHDGGIPWWERHWTRLRAGAARLAITTPDADQVAAEAGALLRAHGDGVIKLVLSRGAGGRGYAPVESGRAQAAPDWQLAWHPLPPAHGRALALRWCALRLSSQPLLAGLKHCNRLEQVLARAEWTRAGADDAQADEGLLRDQDGDVVGAVSANVFAYAQGRWTTPKVDRCGVAGVCRAWALAALDAREARLPPDALDAADAVFLCNAVRGILPVARLGGRHWPAHPAVAAAQARLAAAHPAFAPPASPPPARTGTEPA